MSDQTTHDVMLQQTAKMQEVLEYFQADRAEREQFKADMRAAFAADQAGYAALKNDLQGVTVDMADFVGTVDPDEASPTNKNHGTFNSIKDLIDAAPKNAHVFVKLLADKTYNLDADIHVWARHIILRQDTPGGRPVVAPNAYQASGSNRFYAFVSLSGGSITFQNLDVHFPTAKANAALDWSTWRTLLVVGSYGAQSVVRADNCKFVGSDGFAITTCDRGVTANVSTSGCQLDGAIYAIKHVNNGIAFFAAQSLTLTNGAQRYDGGTVGQNIIGS